jgi:hypothetical protein
MRPAALILAILCTSAALVPAALAKDKDKNKDYQWKDAKVIDITSDRGGPVVVPVAALVGVPVTKTFYWIQTSDTIYVLGPLLTKRQLLNVTLHEPTRIAIDGNTAHILDDYGKDRKIPIAEKVARPKPTDPQ